MKKSNQKGFINIIIYLLILVIFVVTVYACVDILELVEIPEEYRISKWINQTLGDFQVQEYETVDSSDEENKTIGVREENSTKTSYHNVEAPNMNTTISSGNFDTEIEPATYFSYYAQLDYYAKIIYTELEKNLDRMKSGTYNVDFGTTFDDLLHEEGGEQTLNDAFQLAINALNFDNPELFYIDISKVYLLTKVTTKILGTTYTVEIGASNGKSYLNSSFRNEQEVRQAISDIEEEKDRIKSRLSGNTENKIRGVHDYLVENLEYDSSVSKDNIYNIYGALINRITVCEGYARAFKAIMDDLEIPCLIACGTGENSSGETESHAWNYVMIDGKWYAMDVTWDDPIIIGNGRVSKDVNYRYYLKGSREFFTNHREDGEIVGNANFKYPTLSVNDY